MSQHIPLADDSYEEEYNKIKEHFNAVLRAFSSKPEKKMSQELKRDLEDVQSTVTMMEQETNSIPPQQRQNHRLKVRKYKEEVEKMKKQVEEANQTLMNSNDLFGNINNYSNRSTAANSSHNTNIKQMSDQSYKLKEAKKALYDIEGQSNDIGFEINRQNEQLDGMISANKDISNELGTSHHLVDRIKKNMVKRKAVLYGVIAFLIICVTFIIVSYFT